MPRSQKYSLLFLRVSLGFLYLYAGLSKLFDPSWTSKAYLENAHVFSSFYQWLAGPSLLPVVDFMNEWGLTLLGVSLILGFLVRLSSPLGALLMLLYYLPQGFPYPNAHAFIVDEHIVYIGVLLYFFFMNAGRIFGLDSYFKRSSHEGM